MTQASSEHIVDKFGILLIPKQGDGIHEKVFQCPRIVAKLR